MEFLGTPRTDAGSATFMNNGDNIDNLSMEKSFLSPSKKQNNIMSHMQSKRGMNSRTPRTRTPLVDRPIGSKISAKPEISPLLKSVTKRNLSRRSKRNGGPQTPEFLKKGFRPTDSSVLETGESYVYGDESVSSVGAGCRETLEIPVASSSAQSTPLAVLPKRDGNGLDQIGSLPLREQEEVMAKCEKENFGLKLKIHHLESTMGKLGPEFNQAALKENTELKVHSVIMRTELARTKKTLNQAERDLEAYRLSLENAQEKIKRKQIGAGLGEEFENLRKDLAAKDNQIEDLHRQLIASRVDNQDIAKLKDSVEDLEVELRNKDRELEAKDDDIERLKEQHNHDSSDLADLEDELESAKRQFNEFSKLESISQELRNALNISKSEAEEAKRQILAAQGDRQRAEDNLNELQDEIANKSFSTKGLSRQLEDKVNKLEDNLASMRSSYNDLQQRLHARTQEVSNLQDRVEDDREASEAREQQLRKGMESLRDEYDTVIRKNDTLTVEIQTCTRELQHKSNAKDVLQTRHDALTSESQTLQRELGKANERLQALEHNLEEVKQHSLDLQARSKGEIDDWSSDLENLRRKLEDEKNRFKAKEESWSSHRRDLESQRDKKEQQALGLQRTVDKLQASEGTLSERETNLEQALESEKQRHRNEEAVLERQIKELQQDVSSKCDALKDLRSEVTKADEDIRTSKRDHTASEEKVQTLEDEIVVLQSMVDEEVERLNDVLESTQKEAKGLSRELEVVKQELKQSQTARANAEAEKKEIIRDLRWQINESERKVHKLELANLAAESPISSARESAYKTEINEVRQELAKAHQQMKESRANMRDSESEARRQYAVLEKEARQRIGEFQQRGEELEHEIADLRLQQEKEKASRDFAEETIKRLRSRLHDLDKDLQVARLNEADDRTIAEERKDLHEMLKDAKLEAEDLKVQIANHDKLMQSGSRRENELRSQLRRVREERSSQTQEVIALTTELESLQGRYERSIENLSRQQKVWEEERQSIISRVRFPNMSSSSLHAADSTELKQLQLDNRENEKRHAAELMKIAKQVQRMRIKFTREEDFRDALVFEKKYLLKQIEVFNACNAIKLDMLRKMGVAPEPEKEKKRPCLRTVALMALAGIRLQRLQQEWAEQQKRHTSPMKRMEQRKQSRKSSGR